MKLQIGNKIKALRRERDITQEDFANMLGVSYQSVSRWENNVCYPDMELLPVMANFFGITVDQLLCVDDVIEKEQVQKYLDEFQEAISRGDVYGCIEIARRGVSVYPNNYTLLNKLMYALFIAGDSDGNIPEWQENMQKHDAEITAIGERIMKYCPDQNIRLEATARLAFQHCEMGRREVGRALYETLPSQEYCKENQMWWGLTEDEELPFLRKKVQQDYHFFRSSVWLLASSGQLSDEESVKIFDKVLELERLAYDDGNTPDLWGSARVPVEMAQRYVRLGDHAKAMAYLQRGAAAAKAFDHRPEKQPYTSLLFGRTERKKSDFETTDTRTLCEIMRDKWLLSEDFDVIRDSAEYKQILESLS